MVVQWLALLPHNKVVGSSPCQGPVSAGFSQGSLASSSSAVDLQLLPPCLVVCSLLGEPGPVSRLPEQRHSPVSPPVTLALRHQLLYASADGVDGTVMQEVNLTQPKLAFLELISGIKPKDVFFLLRCYKTF